VIWLDQSIEAGGRLLLGVERWAKVRRMRHVERLSQREIDRRTGIHRDTIRRALDSPEPPSYGPRPRRASKLDLYLAEGERLLDGEPTLSGVRIREEIEQLGYDGGKTIVDDLLREIRPRYLRPRSFQRTSYRRGELCQFDLCEPRREVPVGWGQTRRGWIVTAELPYSRAFAGALVFSKELADMSRRRVPPRRPAGSRDLDRRATPCPRGPPPSPRGARSRWRARPAAAARPAGPALDRPRRPDRRRSRHRPPRR
jgi:hypothetical protein